MTKKQTGALRPGWKAAAIALVTVLVLVRIGYLAFGGEADRQRVVSAQYELTGAAALPCAGLSQKFIAGQDRLLELLLCFSDLPGDGKGAVTLGIYRQEQLIYQTDLQLDGITSGEWKPVYINAPMRRGCEYTLILDADAECASPPGLFVVKEGWAPEITGSYLKAEPLDGNLAINYVYQAAQPGVGIACAGWLVLLMCGFFSILHAQKIWAAWMAAVERISRLFCSKVFAVGMELAGCVLILSCSGIEFQGMTKVLLFAVSVLAMRGYPQKRSYAARLADTPLKKAALYGLCFYAAFSLVGQRIFIYPLNLRVKMAGLLVYGGAVWWFIPIIKSLLYRLEQLSHAVFRAKARMAAWKLIGICSAALLLPAAVNLAANNPGISNIDTYLEMVWNAHTPYGMWGWNPAFYCLTLSLIQKVWDSTYAVILTHYAFWLYVTLELLLYLRKKGLCDAALVLLAVLLGFNAANVLHLNSLWKDVPYTLSLFWCLVIFAKLTIDFEEYQGRWYPYFELAAALTGVFLYRKNGTAAFAVLAVGALLVLPESRRLLLSVAASIVCIGFIIGPVYTHFRVVSPGRNGMYIGLSQDILGVYFAGGQVSESTLQMINVMTGYNNAEYRYTPTYADQTYDLDVPPGRFIGCYINTFLHNPVLMARAVAARQDAVWNIYAGRDAQLRLVNYTGTLDGQYDWNAFYPARVRTGLSQKVALATDYTADAQWLAAIEWRCGLLLLAAAVCAVWLVLRTGTARYLLIFLPAAAQIVSLVLSTGWSDFRYFWPINLLSLGSAALVLAICGEKNKAGGAGQGGGSFA